MWKQSLEDFPFAPGIARLLLALDIPVQLNKEQTAHFRHRQPSSSAKGTAKRSVKRESDLLCLLGGAYSLLRLHCFYLRHEKSN